MPDMRLYLLGTLRLTVDGRPVSIDSPFLSASLLAYLALSMAQHGRLVSRFKIAGRWHLLARASTEQQARQTAEQCCFTAYARKLDAGDAQLAGTHYYTADANTLGLKRRSGSMSTYFAPGRSRREISRLASGARRIHVAICWRTLTARRGCSSRARTLHNLYLATLAQGVL